MNPVTEIRTAPRAEWWFSPFLFLISAILVLFGAVCFVLSTQITEDTGGVTLTEMLMLAQLTIFMFPAFGAGLIILLLSFMALLDWMDGK